MHHGMGSVIISVMHTCGRWQGLKLALVLARVWLSQAFTGPVRAPWVNSNQL